MKTVIMAGGMGSRIRSVDASVPKPMLKIGGKPVLEWEIRRLGEQGFHDVMITTSYLGSAIENYFGDGEKFRAKISYYHEETALGNAGALFKMRDILTDDFLLLNADAVFDVDFRRFVSAHKRMGGLATIFTHPNSHPYDSVLLMTDERNAATRWLTKESPRPRWYQNRVNAGLHVLSPAALDWSGIDPETVGRPANGKPFTVDLDRQILTPLCGAGKLFCYDSPEYVKDMGTPERYEAVKRDFASGLIAARSLRRKRKALFLDRDGTINRNVGFLRKIEDFEPLPGVGEAIRNINASGYLAIVATNQPVLARGELSFEGLRQIHDKMETLLGYEGAFLDGVYFCPHHPRKGYQGEVPALKIDCDCRKPKPGMLLKAAEDFHIDLTRSWMIGDSENDVKAGKAAGCRTALIGAGNYAQDLTADSLPDAVERILRDA